MPRFEKEKQMILSKEEREDKRSFLQLRPLFMKIGVNGQANGSSYLECGKTKIICTVFGPRESIKYQYR